MARTVFRILCAGICFVLVWQSAFAQGQTFAASTSLRSESFQSLDDLKVAYPNARFVRVDPANLESVRETYRARGYEVADFPRMAAATASGDKQEASQDESKQDRVPSSQPENDGGGGGGRGSFNVNPGGGGKDAAVIIFAVIGIFVIAFLAVAGIQAAYDYAINGHDHKSWQMTEISYGFVQVTNPDYSPKESNGQRDLLDSFDIASVRYRLGILNSRVDDPSPSRYGIGATLEIGRIAGYVGLANDKHDAVHVDGNYILLGPSLLVREPTENAKYPGAIFLDLLGGVSSNPDVKTLAVARASFLFNFRMDHPGPYLGFEVGGIYIRVDDPQGLGRESGNFNLLVGAIAGYKF